MNTNIFVEANNYINALKIFLNMNELVAYHDNVDMKANVTVQFLGITPEDESFLIQKAITTIEDYSETTQPHQCPTTSNHPLENPSSVWASSFRFWREGNHEKSYSEVDAEFLHQLNDFFHTNLVSHQSGLQSLHTTINNLSKAASALIHLKERRSFLREANHYQNVMNQTSLSRQSNTSSVRNQHVYKTETNKLRKDTIKKEEKASMIDRKGFKNT